MPDGPAKLSVVVGTYNRRDQIQRTIESVVAQTQTPYRLYVTDAGSTDGTVDYLRSVSSPRIIPILTEQKLGQARAYNDVFRMVETPYVCWLSDDNEVVDGGLDTALQTLQSDPRIGMVGLKVKDVVGPFAEAPYIGGVSEYGILNVNQGMLRTDVLREVGCFSEEFRDYGIDPDLTAKVLLTGRDVVYTRAIALRHYRNWETDPSSPEFFLMQERQRAYLARYRTVYADQFPPSLSWRAKVALVDTARLVLARAPGRRAPGGPSDPARGEFLGMNSRDWHNCLAGRYIHLHREVLRRNGSFHLRQYAPGPGRRASLRRRLSARAS